jgi:hypothetical protein
MSTGKQKGLLLLIMRQQMGMLQLLGRLATSLLRSCCASD